MTKEKGRLAHVTSVARSRLPLAFIASLAAFAVQAEPQVMTLTMQPPKDYFREQCFVLELGNTLTYKITTQHPVEFNLHFHRNDGQTIYPVKQVVKSQLSKQHVAESASVYCFMATNLEDQQNAFDVVLSYDITAK